MSKIRVLVVDDSATMRGMISAVLLRDPEIEIAGTAGDPLEAREAIKRLDPDVITLDIEMPNMNGLAFLEKLMRLRPTPVIMVSTLTQRGAESTLKALELGAFDCVGKPTHGHDDSFSTIAEKVKAAARARSRLRPPEFDRPAPAATPNFTSDGRVVAIGSSTGGVEALLTILAEFPANCPPTVITQHMPGSFTTSFAQRLDRSCAARVAEATDGAPLQAGQIYLAPGGERHLEVTGSGTMRCRLRAGDLTSGHRPSVDVLFDSVAKSAGAQAVGVILTGMGRDGAQGLLTMRKAGADTLGQDEASSIVYGMPRVAQEIGAVAHQTSLGRMAGAILGRCNTSRPGRTA